MPTLFFTDIWLSQLYSFSGQPYLHYLLIGLSRDLGHVHRYYRMRIGISLQSDLSGLRCWALQPCSYRQRLCLFGRGYDQRNVQQHFRLYHSFRYKRKHELLVLQRYPKILCISCQRKMSLSVVLLKCQQYMHWNMRRRSIFGGSSMRRWKWHRWGRLLIKMHCWGRLSLFQRKFSISFCLQICGDSCWGDPHQNKKKLIAESGTDVF